MYNLDQSQKDEQKEVITLASQEQQSESPQLRQGSFKYLGVDVYQSDILTFCSNHASLIYFMLIFYFN